MSRERVATHTERDYDVTALSIATHTERDYDVTASLDNRFALDHLLAVQGICGHDLVIVMHEQFRDRTTARSGRSFASLLGVLKKLLVVFAKGRQQGGR
jgi:hypothetical protein